MGRLKKQEVESVMLDTKTISEVTAARDALADAAAAFGERPGDHELFDKLCIDTCCQLVGLLVGAEGGNVKHLHTPHHDAVLVTSGLLAAVLRFAISLVLTRSDRAVGELREALVGVERLQADMAP